MDADDELFGALDKIAETATLLVACGFEGALVDADDDPSGARAVHEASTALNVLVSCPDTVVAVISARPADEVAELMFLSGAKGGLRVVGPGDAVALRDEVGATGVLALGAGDALAEAARPGDVVVGVGVDPPTEFAVEDLDDVTDALEELADLRRG